MYHVLSYERPSDNEDDLPTLCEILRQLDTGSREEVYRYAELADLPIRDILQGYGISIPVR